MRLLLLRESTHDVLEADLKGCGVAVNERVRTLPVLFACDG